MPIEGLDLDSQEAVDTSMNGQEVEAKVRWKKSKVVWERSKVGRRLQEREREGEELERKMFITSRERIGKLIKSERLFGEVRP